MLANMLLALYLVTGFWVGSVISSYFNVVIARGFIKSLWQSSYCDSCGNPLKSWQLIPVISSTYYLFVKSPCCGKKTTINYLITEILGGITGLLIVLRLETSTLSLPSIILLILAITLFLYLAIEDIWKYEINITLAVSLIVGFFLWANILPHSIVEVFSSTPQLLAAIIYGLIVLLLIIFSKGKGLGVGDIYLVFFMGLSLGLRNALIALQISIYTSALVGIMVAIFKKKYKGLIIPLVPFLFLGWLVVISFPLFPAAVLHLLGF